MGRRTDYQRLFFRRYFRYAVSSGDFSPALVTRVLNILNDNGVEFIWDFEKTPIKDMLEFKGIGPESAKLIKTAVIYYGKHGNSYTTTIRKYDCIPIGAQ